MARIRTIKPELFANDSLAELSHAHRLLFIGLWTLADREGRMEDRPQRIWAQLFPYEKALDVDAMLDDLVSAGFIVRYSVGGDRFVEVSGFQKHQRPHPKEPPSALPGRGGTAAVVAPGRWVYFVQGRSGGPIKIGSASNVTNRVESLQTSHHEELIILATVPFSSATERELHARFAGSLLRGEWFSPSPDLLTYITQCKTAVDERSCIPDASPSIPSSPVGREGKGREGDLGREGKETSGEPAAADAAPPEPDESPAGVLQELWNASAPPLPRWKDLTKGRKTAAKARWEEHPDPAYWRDVITRMAASDFCTGRNGRGWRADPEFLLRPDTATRVLEGAFDNRLRGDVRTSPLRAEDMQHSAEVGEIEF